MISLVGSLADNKSALGRRYGEWAVSAPTIESAVAAAAMAQDELGHARSTYPVLAKLGVAARGRGPRRRASAARRSRRAPGLGIGHRRQPGRRRDPDDVRRHRPATARSSRSPSARERSSRRRAPTACTRRRGCGGSCRAGGDDRALLLAPDRRDVGRRLRAGRVPTRTPATGRRSPQGWSARGRRRSARACATGSPGCSTTEGAARRSRTRRTGRLGRGAPAVSAELPHARSAAHATSSWSRRGAGS